MSQISSSIRLSSWFQLDYLAVTLVGLAFLLASYLMIYQGPVLSDEVHYVVVGRNIAEQGHLNTNIYWTESVVRRGYPTRDYHAPGYMITLAAVMALFGPDDSVVGWPGQIAYVLAGVLFYALGKSLFKPAVAFWGTFLFYLYPINFVYANLIMVESILLLLAVIWVALWLKIDRTDTPGWLSVVGLSLIIVIGMLFRQTFIIFLPPALLIVAKSIPTQRNYRPVLIFGGLTLFLLVVFFLPLNQNRAYYPNAIDRALAASDLWAGLGVLQTTFVNNVSNAFAPVPIQRYIALANFILALVSIVGLWLCRGRPGRFTFLYFYLFWTAAFMYSVIYKSVVDLSVARHLATFIWPGLLLLVAFMFQLKQRYLRYGGLLAFTMLLGVGTVQFTGNIQLWQQDAIRRQAEFDHIFRNFLQPYAPQSILFERGYKLAWTHYPATVVTDLPADYGQMPLLEERLPIDIIVVDSDQKRDVIADAVAQGVLRQQYSLLFSYDVDGYYFFVSDRLSSP